MKQPDQAGLVAVLHEYLCEKSGEVWGSHFEIRTHG
jgi:hypothetical protein